MSGSHRLAESETLGWGNPVHGLESIDPIVGPAVQVHHGNDHDLLRINSIQHCVGESEKESTSDVATYDRPSLGAFSNVFQRIVNSGEEIQAGCPGQA